MNKARKRFILFAELSIILLLSVLLTVINVLNFTMAAEDADIITGNIAKVHGVLLNENEETGKDPGQRPDEDPPPMPSEESAPPQDNGIRQRGASGGFVLDGDRKDFMGPKSKDMNPSLRFFTVAFDEDGNAETISFRISAVTEDEAQTWAESLLDGTKGWTNLTYRYRVYENEGKTYVSVVDQSRELYPSFRILMISVIGGLVMIGVSLIFLLFIGRKLFKPVEEADRKQQQFITRLEREFKMPLTVISANTETLERESGASEQTKSINKQVRRMTGLIKELSSLSVVKDLTDQTAAADFSDLASAVLENVREKFEARNLDYTYTVDPSIELPVDEEALHRMLKELLSNSLKFSLSQASIRISKHQDRIVLCQTNDTKLPDGSYDQIFDRFTRLDNAEGTEGSGLGLSYVKELVKVLNGRVSAAVKNGTMTITIDL